MCPTDPTIFGPDTSWVDELHFCRPKIWPLLLQILQYNKSVKTFANLHRLSQNRYWDRQLEWPQQEEFFQRLATNAIFHRMFCKIQIFIVYRNITVSQSQIPRGNDHIVRE